MSLLITSSNLEDEIIVKVEGEVDVSCAAELRGALDTALSDGTNQITVDVAEMSYIDSTGIGVLVGFAHRALEKGAQMKLLNPQRNVLRVFSLLGLDEQLAITLDQDAAVTEISETSAIAQDEQL